MTETLCNSGHVKFKAGADATALTAAEYTTLINQAEGQLFTDTGVDWVAIYSGLSDNTKKVLEGAVSAKAANPVINYDLSVFPSLNYATTQINVNLDEYDRAVAKLKDPNISGILGGSQASS